MLSLVSQEMGILPSSVCPLVHFHDLNPCSVSSHLSVFKLLPEEQRSFLLVLSQEMCATEYQPAPRRSGADINLCRWYCRVSGYVYFLVVIIAVLAF